MATYSKIILSGSTNGRQILVAATATAGTLIHTAVTGTTNLDEIWIYAVNTDAADKLLTVEYGGVSSPADTIILTIPGKEGLILVVPGLLLQNELVVRAFAETTNVVAVSGFVNRITA